jgi:hypothetical protein
VARGAGASREGDSSVSERHADLETVFESDAGAVRLIDFMPLRGRAPDIVRIVEGLGGAVAMAQARARPGPPPTGRPSSTEAALVAD